MKKRRNVFLKIKLLLAGIGWKLFLWGNDLIEEDDFDEIYTQEKYYREELIYKETHAN